MGNFRNKFMSAVFLPLAALFLLTGHDGISHGQRVSGDIHQEVYIWQRSWSGQVRESVEHAKSVVSGFVVLGAEVGFQNGDPDIMRVAIDYSSLRESGVSVGLAIRIGPYSGQFSGTDETARMLCDIAGNLISDAESNGIILKEIQIDFDAAESKLDGYRLWLDAIREEISPIPLTITALPTWMNSPDFSRLIRSTDGFVLQVHSLEPPDGIDSHFTLCDPERSLAWIERASNLCPPGIDFRVALPTYGYTVAFDSAGEFYGLSAEGPDPDWPEGTLTKEVMSNPDEISMLVDGLMKNRPDNLAGLIWYRMPVDGDSLNWPWQTLEACMEGRAPERSITIQAESTQTGLVDLYLVNNGETSEKTDLNISVTWSDADLLAFDLLRDYVITDRGPGTVILQGPSKSPQSSQRIGPGESWMVSWLRFDRETEVQIDVSGITQ